MLFRRPTASPPKEAAWGPQGGNCWCSKPCRLREMNEMIATKVRKKEELGNLGNFTFVLNQVFARKYLGCVEEASESWADFPIYISLAPGWLCICSFWATATSGGSFNPLALREIEGIMSEWVYTPQISHVFIFFIFIMGKMIINHDFCGPDWHRLCLTVQ